VAGIAGPGLGGVLVQWLTAPVAILADALSFFLSALFLATIKTPEPPPIPHEQRGTWRLVSEGMRVVLGNPILRGIVTCGVVHNFFSRMIDALYVLYLTQTLGIAPALLGATLALGGPGALLGALMAAPAAKRFGIGPTCIVAQVVTGASRLCIPLAGLALPMPASVGILMLGQFLLGVARPVFNVNQVSLRQGITPNRLQGRVNATMRFIMWSVTPVGALLGGGLAVAIGIQQTLWLAGAGVLLAVLPAYLSPLRVVREHPQVEGATPA
jgi:predicted MFS family arabinose efflux permease